MQVFISHTQEGVPKVNTGKQQKHKLSRKQCVLEPFMMTVAQQSNMEMETEQMLQQELDKNTSCVFT